MKLIYGVEEVRSIIRCYRRLKWLKRLKKIRGQMRIDKIR